VVTKAIDSGPGEAERVYLSDFGLTKDALSDEPLTQSGQYLGTPLYSAPEQAQGKKDLDGRADQYALACRPQTMTAMAGTSSAG
jgi:serine/threonine protein kinase